MTRFGKCSVCEVVHPAPFGSRCKFMADAKALCAQKGIPEDKFKDHLDYAGMPKPGPDNDLVEPTDSGGIDISAWTPAMIQDLVKMRVCQENLVLLYTLLLVPMVISGQSRTRYRTRQPVQKGTGYLGSNSSAIELAPIVAIIIAIGVMCCASFNYACSQKRNKDGHSEL